jgi:hypothetical protein
MKRRAESPLLDEERPRRSKRMYRGNDLLGTQVRRSPLLVTWRLTDAPSENGNLNVYHQSSTAYENRPRRTNITTTVSK